jgi:hypothetical protein
MTCLGSLIHDYINLGLELEQADDVGCSSNCGPRIITANKTKNFVKNLKVD